MRTVDGAIRFPGVTGDNLARETYDLPGDFEGDLNLLFVAFRRRQQGAVDTWVPLADQLEAEFPGLRYYELPVISRLYRPVKWFIDGGMRGGIPDEDTRERTITVYTDTDAFRDPLGIDSEDTIQVLLVDPAGTVHWRTTGPKTDVAAEELRAVLEDLP